MTDYSKEFPNFHKNFDYLIDNGAIPKTDADHLGHSVMQAINDLEGQELDTLVNLAKKAKAHLFVHDTDNKVVAMGL